MLSQQLLAALSVAAVVSASSPGKHHNHARTPHDHTFAKRSLHVVDSSLLEMDLRRVNGKYKHSRHSYEANFAKFGAAGLSKRHETVQQAARELEARALDADSLAQGASKRKVKRAPTSGRESLTDYYQGGQDVLYYGTISIGSGSQDFNIDFDTGSADLWVPAQTSSTTHTKINQNASNTLETSTAEWDITYGTGQSQGFLARDQVTVAGLTVPKQIFALATVSAPSLEALPVDGFMGMGFSTIATSGAPTFFENLITNKLVAQPYFGFYFGRGSDLTNAESKNIANAGEMCIGCLDSGKYTGSISYNKVVSQGYWEVAMDGVTVDGKLISGTSCNAALDTGTTLIYLPTATASALFSSIGGKPHGNSGSYAVPCAATFQTFGLTFNGVTYNIPLSDLFLGYASSSSTSQCLLGIVAADQIDPDGNEVAIVGDLFLKAVYSVFSYSNGGSPAVGLAVSSTSGVSSVAAAASGSGAASGAGKSSSAFVATGRVASITKLDPVPTAITTHATTGTSTTSLAFSSPPADPAAAASAAAVAAADSASSSTTGTPTGFDYTAFSVVTVAGDSTAAPSASTQSSSATTTSRSSLSAVLAVVLGAGAAAFLS